MYSLGHNFNQILMSNNLSRSLHGTRRKFITDIAKFTTAGMVLATPIGAFASSKSWTVGEIMDLFIQETTNTPFQQTVDTLKAGDRETVVKGIVTTMFATIPAIRRTIELGANFIIAHEPTFYSHTDKTDWLENDDTYIYKRKLLQDNKIAIWRNHDYIHSHKPDGVFDGMLARLGWSKFAQESSPWDLEIPAVTLSQLISTLKEKLSIKTVRYIGDENQLCKKVLLMPGAPGGERQIKAISELRPDVAILGELQEWETAEYIRDTQASGKKTSLILIGHIPSEDAGSEYMKKWLAEKVPGIKVTYLSSVSPFSYR
jgi:putative NIF3 family GTP cyclohydrolase 1 type 2